MGQKQLMAGLIMFSVFVIAVLSFSIGYANDNNAVISIADDPDIKSLNVTTKGNLSSFRVTTNSSEKSFFELKESDTEIKTPAQFKIGIFTLIATTTGVLSTGYEKIFGSGGGFGFVLIAFSSFMGSLVILYIWKTLKGGNPD